MAASSAGKICVFRPTFTGVKSLNIGALRCAKAEAISRVLVGVWLSPVEHCVRDAGVAGSNPATPTRYSILSTCYRDSYWDRNGSATDYLNKQGDGCAKVSAPGVC